MADNDYPKEGKPMDTKDHPDVQGSGAILSDMVARGRTIQEQDQDNSRRAAFNSGRYNK